MLQNALVCNLNSITYWFYMIGTFISTCFLFFIQMISRILNLRRNLYPIVTRTLRKSINKSTKIKIQSLSEKNRNVKSSHYSPFRPHEPSKTARILLKSENHNAPSKFSPTAGNSFPSASNYSKFANFQFR